jgi:bis(5'-nucleosyl)-tetraphosphatase (symmetrical)
LILKHQGALLVHAGIPPQWNISDAVQNAELVHQQLQVNNPAQFLSKMYSDEPSYYSDKLNNEEKCRYTINALMRMRFCKKNGELEFNHKMNIDQAPVGFKAWFLHTNRKLKDKDIFFGHWSTLKGFNIEHVYPMDHGCIWGERLSAYRLTDRTLISQESIENN